MQDHHAKRSISPRLVAKEKLMVITTCLCDQTVVCASANTSITHMHMKRRVFSLANVPPPTMLEEAMGPFNGEPLRGQSSGKTYSCHYDCLRKKCPINSSNFFFAVILVQNYRMSSRTNACCNFCLVLRKVNLVGLPKLQN